jgi:predicted nucleic acid-binding protein
MSDRYFVDTNILMYAHDSAAGDKHARAKALVEDFGSAGQASSALRFCRS